jgi:phosphotransferase system  glucose/maltose/N-acetylglucosamine-specific IIC component
MKHLMYQFLYFPEDKSGYIPAAFEFLIMLILCIVVFTVFRKISKKQELKSKEIEARILSEKHNTNNQQNI